MQYETWQSLYRKHSGKRVVSRPRRGWLVLRDLYCMSVVFCLAFLLSWPLNVGVRFAIAAPYLFVFGAQAMFLLLGARRLGTRFVNNVLATELGLGPAPEGDRARRKQKRRRG